MIREIRFPVPLPPALLDSKVKAVPSAVASCEYYVLMYDDARDVWMHPTSGRMMDGWLYQQRPTFARHWLRGLID